MNRPVVILFVICCAASAGSVSVTATQNTPTAAQNAPTAAPNTTTTTQKTTTAAHNTTTAAHNTTTAPHNTTTAPHNTTTPAHNTTTAPHNTTTPAHNTTTAPHNTTTATTNTTTAPSSTTTPPPPPPPEPTPSTNLTVGNYTLKDKDVVCLKAHMALQIRVATSKANGTFIIQPKATKAEGGCEKTKANLTLVFPEGFITFMFNKSSADDTVYVSALSLNLAYAFSKGAKANFTANNDTVHLFAAKVGHSYSCKADSIFLGRGLYLDVTQDRMQAFSLTKSNDFGFPDHCPADQPDYRVAIAVGVILLVLIIIVVVVYLLSRRKRTSGYQPL